MKKLTLFILGVAIGHSLAFSQSCLPEGITFTTQEQIDSFQINYPGCTEIEGNVIIEGAEITNLIGLNVLNSIGGYLTISNDSSLVHLTGLENLNAIGGALSIYGNVLLSDIADLAELDSVGGGIGLGIEIWNWWTGQYSYIGNQSLTSFSGLQGITSVAGLSIIGNDLLTNLTGLNNIISISGTLSICGNNSLANFQGLDALTEIGYNLIVQENNQLNDFEGLNSLTSVAGKVKIGRDTRIGYEDWPPPGGNDLLESFSGIDNLTSIGSDLIIGDNHSLASLSGLTGVTSIGGSIIITSDTNLISLIGLRNVNFINGELAIQGTALTDLDGLDNISAGTINELYIGGNSSLSSCEVQSICNYLTSPSGIINIYNNANGCNNPEEVKTACQLGVDNYASNHNLTIYPNPSSDQFTFEFSLQQQSKVKLLVLNSLGQGVATLAHGILNPGPHQLNWNAKKWPAGMYFLQLKTDNQTVTKKIIKQ